MKYYVYNIWSIEWVPGGGDRFSYSIDVILTVCLGEHGNMRSATYIHPSTIHTSNDELQKISSKGKILHSSRRVQFL
ncbi:unnamed protein product [Sphagnum balticum]